MKVATIPPILAVALLLSSAPLVASQQTQTTSDCAVQDCTPFLNLVQNCGVDLSAAATATASTASVLTSAQDRCICRSSNSQAIISTCLSCLNKSNTLGSGDDTFPELCPAATGRGPRSCSAFGGAPYVVSGLMAGLGLFGMAA